MKAITISQPFASLIASGEKWIENRTWPTSYRGPIAIHAGKGLQYLSKEGLANYPSGGVVAIARLAACITYFDIAEMALTVRRKRLIPGTTRNWSEAHRHKHSEGPFCWFLEDVSPCEFFAAKGKQGLWDLKGWKQIVRQSDSTARAIMRRACDASEDQEELEE